MFELFKTAYELKPTAGESRIIYTVGAIYVGNKEVLKEMLSNLSKDIIITDDRFLRAYSDVGDYNSVLTILNARVEKSERFTK